MKKIKDRGHWLQTYTGIHFYILDPQPKEIDIGDITHSLSMMCRFGGHCYNFYSVAQHCCIVHDLGNFLFPSMANVTRSEFDLALLLHDAAEAYIGDNTRPKKKIIPKLETMERKIINVIFKKYGLSKYEDYEKIIKYVDDAVLIMEAKQLKGISSQEEWNYSGIPEIALTIDYWDSITAKREFKRRFCKLYKEPPF